MAKSLADPQAQQLKDFAANGFRAVRHVSRVWLRPSLTVPGQPATASLSIHIVCSNTEIGGVRTAGNAYSRSWRRTRLRHRLRHA